MQVDATHGATAYGLFLFFLCVKDNLNKVRCVGTFICKSEDTAVLTRLFTRFKDENPHFEPTCLFSDDHSRQIAALEETWDVPVFLCWVHLDRAWLRSPLKHCDEGLR